MSLWDWLFGKLSTPRTDAAPGAKVSHGATSPRTPGAATVAAAAGRSGVATAPAISTSLVNDADPGAPDAWWSPDPDDPREPQPVPCPNLSAEARAIKNVLISHFDGHDLQVPPLMQAAERVLRLLGKANCDFGHVARELNEDPVMAGSVLRLANSPLYRGERKITSVQLAVPRLGQKALRTLMLHESMRAAMFGGKGRDPLAEVLWRRSLASAVIMQELAGLCSGDSDDAYLLGLLHDIGAILVLRIVRGVLRLAKFEINEEEFDFLCSETHQELGELITTEWKLPPTVAAIVSDHHRYPHPDDPQRRDRLQIILCDMILAMLELSSPARYDLLHSRPAQDLGLAGRADFRIMLTDLPALLDEVFGHL